MLIQTDSLDAAKLKSLDEPTTHQLYCGLDCCLTLEVFEELSALCTPSGASAPDWPVCYSFERALQAPALDMMLRGFKIDQFERHKAIRQLRGDTVKGKGVAPGGEIGKFQSQLDELATVIWDKGLNVASPKQMKEFFYKALRLPEVVISDKGTKRVSTNREALEKLNQYFHARPLVELVFAIRDLQGVLRQLESEIDPDGRFRMSINIGGTETGRFSTSKSVTGTGGNGQNLKRDDDLEEGELSIRRCFVADRGWKLVNIDLEQTESRDVGFLQGTLLGDWRYLDACEQGDLHTAVAKMVWPELGWVKDARANRKLADQNFYRHFSYRDMAKRGGHLCLTEDHEVLTTSGWVPISEKPEEILVWSEEGSYFSRVEHWTDEICTDQELIEFNGRSISLLMTPNHRIPYYKSQTDGLLYVARADELTKGSIPLGDGYAGGNAIISAAEARLIAAFQSDGHQKSPNRVEFHFHKERKFQRLAQLAKAADIIYWRKGDKAYLHANSWPKKCGAFMLSWNRAAIKAFVDEYKHWDGHIGLTAVSLCSVDRMQLEWIQTLGRLVGVGGNIQKPQKGYSERLLYRLQQNKRRFCDISRVERKSVKVKAEQRVYCPTVTTEFFYVRRQGKICVTGNTNYMGTAWTAARSLKVPQKLMDDFQLAYTTAFPAFPAWWQWVAQRIQTNAELTTPYGRRRMFFGRRDDDSTLREAIAFVPQSMTADRMNLGLWRVWKHMPEVQLLAQVHDSICFQFRETGNSEHERDIVQRALKLIEEPLVAPNGRVVLVGGEAKVGWNWGAKGPANPEGLQKWSATLPDTRRRKADIERML